jgi:RNA polymerase sigma-70 factor (ECF subfamily)
MSPSIGGAACATAFPTNCLTGSIPASVNADRANLHALDEFLKAVERRALRMAELAAIPRDEALDLVQDAMLGFVHHYAGKPPAEWPPLFYRVVDNRLNDWHRRHNVRSRWIDHFHAASDDGAEDALEAMVESADPGPLRRLAGREAGQALEAALIALPRRQRQAFLLRLWEGLDGAETAAAMNCSEGSVKTHLSRALAALRRALKEHQ